MHRCMALIAYLHVQHFEMYINKWEWHTNESNANSVSSGMCECIGTTSIET